MAYQWLLVVSTEAQQQIDKLSRNDRMLIFDKLAELLNADDPTNQTDDPNNQTHVTDIKRLKEARYEGLWRKRAGNWRILYHIEEAALWHLNVEYKGKLIVAAVVNRRDL